MKRILIAEDDGSTQRLLAILLTQAGWDVVVASDGQAARRILETQTNFQLLITDIRMPKLDGFHLIEWVKRAIPYLPILTISIFDQWGRQARQQGSDAFLRKPFSRQQLLTTIQGLIKQPFRGRGFQLVNIYATQPSQ